MKYNSYEDGVPIPAEYYYGWEEEVSGRKPPHKMASVASLVATAEQGLRGGGERWYDEALVTIREIASLYEESLVYVAALVAATSPQVTVNQNVAITMRYLEDGELSYFPLHNQSIWKLETEGRRAGLVDYAKHLGPKTGPFAFALLGDETSIVIDTHVLKALKLKPNELSRTATRSRAIGRIQAAASRLTISPRCCQAALWLAKYQEVFPNKEPSFPRPHQVWPERSRVHTI